MTWSTYQQVLLAILLWREARGEGEDGLRAVAHVVRNRVLSSAFPDTWEGVIAQPWQFSSMTATGDSQLRLWPKAPDPNFDMAMDVASRVFTGDDYDLTQGATHYYAVSIPPPSWAAQLKFLVQIGHQRFYS